jgi:hypothetical protein
MNLSSTKYKPFPVILAIFIIAVILLNIYCLVISV